jgi:site-specific recombinase XerD
LDFERFLADWRNRKRCSDQTIRSYRSDLKMFASFLQERGVKRITQVDHAVINDFIQALQTKQNSRFRRTGLAESSISRRLSAISSYFEYTRATTNPKLRNPIADLTHRWRKNDEPKPADDATIDKLLDGIDNLRDKVLFALLLVTGLRVSEAHSLNRDTIQIKQVSTASGTRFVGEGQIIGKGRKQRTFFVEETTLALYARYVAMRTDDDPALFLSERKQRMSVRAMQYALSAWCKKLGIPHLHVHQLRTTFATKMANAHMDSMVLKDLLGHNDLNTTQKYVAIRDQTLARGYFSAMEYLRT